VTVAFTVTASAALPTAAEEASIKSVAAAAIGVAVAAIQNLAVSSTALDRRRLTATALIPGLRALEDGGGEIGGAESAQTEGAESAVAASAADDGGGALQPRRALATSWTWDVAFVVEAELAAVGASSAAGWGAAVSSALTAGSFASARRSGVSAASAVASPAPTDSPPPTPAPSVRPNKFIWKVRILLVSPRVQSRTRVCGTLFYRLARCKWLIFKRLTQQPKSVPPPPS
jgi:hypothetical protein